MKKIVLLLTSLLICIPAFGVSLNQLAKDVKRSKQMLIVVTPEWGSISGTLQRFEKAAKTDNWKKVGEVIPVVVGKQGMAWDSSLQMHSAQESVKKEGDGKTPVGVYKIGPLFGFKDKADYQGNYFPLTTSSVCVDDAKSAYYNQLIDAEKVTRKDWNSAEQMRQIPQYQLGIMVQYNQAPNIKNAGSCIFMHIWRHPSSGTAGCVAMDKANLTKILFWLNDKKNPVIVLMPLSVYQTVHTAWKLPQVEV